MGNVLGDFMKTDSATSSLYQATFSCRLVEIDVSKGLPNMISVDSPLGSWNILLDYEGIPFHYKNYHLTGHLATRCSSKIYRPKISPSWWKGILDDHHTYNKATENIYS